MISYQQLQNLAKTRLRDARILYSKRRYNGAVCICGYANELALKTMICKTINLEGGIPNLSCEFSNIQKIKTHDLEELLSLLDKLIPGIKNDILTKKQNVWNGVLDWNPDKKYLPIDEKSVKQWEQEANGLIKYTANILNYLWKKL